MKVWSFSFFFVCFVWQTCKTTNKQNQQTFVFVLLLSTLHRLYNKNLFRMHCLFLNPSSLSLWCNSIMKNSKLQWDLGYGSSLCMENFSKTLNCYLLIKYWFNIPSFYIVLFVTGLLIHYLYKCSFMSKLKMHICIM